MHAYAWVHACICVGACARVCVCVLAHARALVRYNHMRYNHIGRKGARQLAAVLRSDKSLTMLGMYGNRIGSEGVGHIADVLKRNTKKHIEHMCTRLRNAQIWI